MSNATPTTAAIAILRTEAGNAGDSVQYEICERALEGDTAAIADCARAIRSAADMGGEADDDSRWPGDYVGGEADA